MTVFLDNYFENKEVNIDSNQDQLKLNRSLYLELLKKSLLDVIYEPLTEGLIDGIIHPPRAHTMIGLKRLNNIQECFQNIVKDNIEGHLIETGVWRGGATILSLIHI